MTRYYIWDGEFYPSVTSILQVIAKPGLVNWAARQVAERAVRDLEGWGLLAQVDPQAAIEKLAQAPWTEKTKAGRLGSRVHQVAQVLAEGRGRVEVGPDDAPYLAALRRFVAEHRPRFLYTEAQVFSRRYGYAGTLDAIADLGDVPTLLDFKTSKGVYPEHHLQVAAYAHADFIGLDGVAVPMPQVSAGVVVHLGAGGYELVRVDIGPETFDIFLAALRLSRWLEVNNGKRNLEAG